MGTRCVYNWTNIMVDMGLDDNVHNDRAPRHSRIFNAWIEDWESNIPRTQDQKNAQCHLQKYKNIRFFGDEENQIYIITPEILEFKGETGKGKQYFVGGKPLGWRDGDDLDLLVSRKINDDFMVIIKGVEQDLGLGVNIVHPSIHDDSEATDSGKEENNNKNTPKTQDDGENTNAYSNDEVNIDEDAPETPYDFENRNASSDDEGNND